jgi:hypothetical protein
VIPSVVLGIRTPAGVDVLIVIIIIIIPASSLLSSHVYYEIERDRW